ncbi:alginate export family protein, partial [Burkholderia sp. Bp9099]
MGRRAMRWAWRGVLPAAVLAGGVATYAGTAAAAEDTAVPAPASAAGTTCTAKRPAVLFNRWQEDWSVLANPCVPRKPLDGLKYIPLGGDP